MRDDTRQSYKARILRVLTHIQKHLDEALGLEELAAVANFSPYHFHRIFRAMVGEPLITHLRRLRLERAAYRLKVSDQPVTRIAFDAGYETHEAFTRAFGATFGSSPSAYRLKHQKIDYGTSSPSGVHYSPGGDIPDFEPRSSKSRLDIQVKRITPINVAFVRHTGPYKDVGEAWGRLVAWAQVKGLIGQGRVIGASYDDPAVTPEEKIRYDACIELNNPVEPEGDVGVQTVGGRTYATFLHIGPYEEAGDIYANLCGEWLPNNGKEAGDAPALEFYMNSPEDTPPKKLKTELCVPVED